LMSRITGGGPRAPTDPPGTGEVGAAPGETAPKEPANLHTKQGIEQFREAARREGLPDKTIDRFEKAGPRLEKTLESLTAKVQFTNAELAQIAAAIAVLVGNNPGADRKKRAKLFTRAILKRRPFDKMFANLDPADETRLEEMFEIISDQLDGSPVLAQLVEEVTEGARRLSSR
jgi:hypothetical protein